MKKKKRTKAINRKKLVLELIVVFLGVTGGFLLNNWREGQKDHEFERKYIESFIQDIDTNIRSLKEVIGEDTVLFESLKIKIALLDSTDIPKDSIINVINMILNVSKLDLKTSAFENIKFSGNLNLIRNYTLKGEIVSYYDLIDDAKYVDGYYNRFFSEMILPFIMENYSLSENRFFTNNHQSQRKLFNIVVGYYSMRMQRTEVLKNVVSESEKLKSDLQKYLDNIL